MPAKYVVAYDPVTRRYRATCATCGFVAVRAKRDAAAWIASQHVAYNHSGVPDAA